MELTIYWGQRGARTKNNEISVHSGTQNEGNRALKSQVLKQKEKKKKDRERDFPGDPLDKTLSFHCKGQDSTPDQGTKILHAIWHNRKRKGEEMEVLMKDNLGWGMVDLYFELLTLNRDLD